MLNPLRNLVEVQDREVLSTNLKWVSSNPCVVLLRFGVSSECYKLLTGTQQLKSLQELISIWLGGIIYINPVRTGKFLVLPSTRIKDQRLWWPPNTN